MLKKKSKYFIVSVGASFFIDVVDTDESTPEKKPSVQNIYLFSILNLLGNLFSIFLSANANKY